MPFVLHSCGKDATLTWVFWYGDVVMSFKKRPLSPHLQIYKPQLTSILSILHRFTGIGLSFGFFLLIGFLYGVVFHERLYLFYIYVSHQLWGKAFIMLFMMTFWYHCTNGIRHLVWDMGYDLEIKNVYTSGYFILIMTILLTVITALLFWGKLV
jgi:succinate dehydrogenase / fumarate reductase cytochrome b subunit